MENELLKFRFKPKHHVLFWTVYFTLNVLRWGAFYDDYVYSIQSNVVEFSLHIAFVYFNILYLIPKYILKGHYMTYMLWLLLCLCLVYVLKTGMIDFLISKKIWPQANERFKPYGMNHIISEFIGELYVLALVSSVYLTFNWLRELERNRALNEKQIKMQIKNLENQIQPHFYFNTLNNLYSLSISKSELVPSTIIRLSKLMKFVLYDVKENNYIPLVKELEYIQNYIDIEKLRFENVKVITNINSDIEQILIPPMIFITFIENAFKHGGYNGVLKIKINCSVEGRYFIFEVINNFIKKSEGALSNGIGIDNVVSRLKLLYNDDFELTQKQKLNYYILKIKMPIKYEN